TLAAGWSLLQRAILQAAGAAEPEFRAAYGRFRDSGDTAESLLARREPKGAAVTLAELAAVFGAIAAARGPSGKIGHLEALFARLHALEAKYVVKIVTGDLRIGLKEGLVEEAI